jgi:RNA polymerase sigma-70 factor (ECF subfamily)
MQEGKHITDEELFQRIKRDDAQALKILFEKYFSLLCRFASKFVRTTDLAEEIVSDIFLNIWLKKETIEIKTSLKTYLYIAVRNQSLNYLKKNRIHLEEIETIVKENRVSDLKADQLITYEELEDDIDTLLQQLPEKRQIIFRLNRLDGLSYKEIAEIFSISIHTVQNQMVAAVKFLTDQHLRHK